MLSLQNSRKKSLSQKIHIFPIHNFIPSLVEPKTLFNDVLRGVPRFFHRKLRFLSFLKIKALTWPATHYWSPYTQFQKLEAVWNHSPQTILADNPLQILLKYRFSWSQWCGAQVSAFLTSCWGRAKATPISCGEQVTSKWGEKALLKWETFSRAWSRWGPGLGIRQVPSPNSQMPPKQ